MSSRTCIGVIDKCVMTRVYTRPSILSDLAGMITRGTEVLIENFNPDRHFCKIVTDTGLEGYCMQPFITIKEEETTNER